MNALLSSYLTCALWSSTDDNQEPLDRNYSLSDIPPAEIAKVEKVCADFQSANAELLALAELSDEQAGHNLWLNRNGHGSGFWDEHSLTTCELYQDAQNLTINAREYHEREKTCNCKYHACQRLSLAANALGESNLYVGDDGNLYFS